MDKSRTSIHNAKNNETESTFADLRLPPVERDKLYYQMPLFKLYIATLPTKSGMHFLF